MLRRLIAMRHAKSSWNSPARTDHARPLNKRGRRDAPRIAAELLRREWVPEIVISSDSVRTRETFSGMHDVLGDVTVEFTNALYHGDLDAIRSEVEALDDAVTTALVLGHNPGWEDAVSTLSGEPTTMTTANAALLSIEAPTWASAIHRERAWSLEALLRPRDLD